MIGAASKLVDLQVKAEEKKGKFFFSTAGAGEDCRTWFHQVSYILPGLKIAAGSKVFLRILFNRFTPLERGVKASELGSSVAVAKRQAVPWWERAVWCK